MQPHEVATVEPLEVSDLVLVDVGGGMLAWVQAGLPIVGDGPRPWIV